MRSESKESIVESHNNLRSVKSFQKARQSQEVKERVPSDIFDFSRLNQTQQGRQVVFSKNKLRQESEQRKQLAASKTISQFDKSSFEDKNSLKKFSTKSKRSSIKMDSPQNSRNQEYKAIQGIIL